MFLCCWKECTLYYTYQQTCFWRSRAMVSRWNCEVEFWYNNSTWLLLLVWKKQIKILPLMNCSHGIWILNSVKERYLLFTSLFFLLFILAVCWTCIVFEKNHSTWMMCVSSYKKEWGREEEGKTKELFLLKHERTGLGGHWGTTFCRI